jgi:uncharacterized protein (TIGR02757 family)
MLPLDELKSFLEAKVIQYNTPAFIPADPIAIPHSFSKKEDIEVAGFLASVIAWGKREAIVKSGFALMDLLDRAPYDFVLNHSAQDLQSINKYVYRTFNGLDLVYLVQALQHLYLYHGGLAAVLTPALGATHMHDAILHFRTLLFSLPHNTHVEKHIGNPAKGAACKRLHLFLKWMVRQDQQGVDFGIWNHISPSVLSCPLDVHVARTATALGLLPKVQSNLKALHHLDAQLRVLDVQDPVKYDFALFGLGIFEKF